MELIKRNLVITKINSTKENTIKTFNRLSASEINTKANYLFFLNEKGRYIADLYFIEEKEEQLIISTETITTNFINHIKKYDIRNAITFEKTNKKIYTTFEKIGTQDPRNKNLGNLIIFEEEKEAKNEKEYQKLRIKEEIAEFEDFEHERSIILEYGSISKFISTTKGCYLGQELMNRTRTQGQIRKTVKHITKEEENVIKIIAETEEEKLALIRI